MTQTDYLVACGAPPLPKDWYYEVKYHPEYDYTRERYKTRIEVLIWAGGTLLISRESTLAAKYIEQLGGKYTLDTAKSAYFSLYQRPQLIPNHLTSLNVGRGKDKCPN